MLTMVHFFLKIEETLKIGANVTYHHFKRLGITIHTGSNGMFKDSKTEAVYFEAPGGNNS